MLQKDYKTILSSSWDVIRCLYKTELSFQHMSLNR